MNSILAVPQVKNLVLTSQDDCPILTHFRQYYQTDMTSRVVFHVSPIKKILYELEDQKVGQQNAIISEQNRLNPSKKKDLETLKRHFLHGRMEDSKEFLELLMDHCKPLYELFKTTFKHSYTCSYCNKDYHSDTLNEYTFYVGGGSSTQFGTTQEMIDNFFVAEDDIEFKCQNECQKNLPHIREMKEINLPKVVAIQILRWEKELDVTGQPRTAKDRQGKIIYFYKKDNKSVIPTQELSIGGQKFYLMSVLVHQGTKNGGHYRSYVRFSKNSEMKWMLMDDNSIVYTNDDPPVKDVYCCFYSPTDLPSSPSLPDRFYNEDDSDVVENLTSKGVSRQKDESDIPSKGVSKQKDDSDTSSNTSDIDSESMDEKDNNRWTSSADDSTEEASVPQTVHDRVDDMQEENMEVDADVNRDKSQKEIDDLESAAEPIGDKCKEFEDFDVPFKFAAIPNIIDRLNSVEEQQVLKEIPSGPKLRKR